MTYRTIEIDVKLYRSDSHAQNCNSYDEQNHKTKHHKQNTADTCAS